MSPPSTGAKAGLPFPFSEHLQGIGYHVWEHCEHGEGWSQINTHGPTRSEAGVRLRFDTTRNVRCGGRKGGPLVERRVSILRCAIASPFSGPVIS